MARLAFAPFLRVFKDNGDVCTNATATWYLAGTTTLTDSYTTSALSTPNTNPVAANSLGIFPAMWLADGIQYKVKIEGTGLTTQTIDYVYSTASLDQLSGDRRYLGLAGGAGYNTTGSSNAYVVTTGLSTGSLATFETILIVPNFTNTGAATLNVDAIGSKNIFRNGLPLRGGEIVSGRPVLLAYDGTQFQIVSATREADNSGYLYGLWMQNNVSDATNDIDIAAGICADSTGARFLERTASITKRLDAAWAVGDAQGGLDTGSIANTTYHVWLIMRSDTGVVDALFSTSASNPTMPSNYDYKRRIGSILREGGAIVAFMQDGDLFMRKTAAADVSATNPGTSAVTRTLSVPTGIRVRALMQVRINTTTTNTNFAALITDLSRNDVTASMTNAQCTIRSLTTAGTYEGKGGAQEMTDTSAQVRSRMLASDASTLIAISTDGWIDTRGRLA